jgi:hypothetical protein
VKYGTLSMSARQVDYRTNEGTKMNSLPTQAEARATEAATEEISNLAKIELDRIWNLFSEASKHHTAVTGKMGEEQAWNNAMEYHKVYSITKDAYKALGLTGSIGIHQL